jgi:ABC-2 type transport system permease protein
MNKTWIVLKSEFLRRVRSKWFIIMTLLAPLIVIALAVLPGLFMYFASQSEQRTVGVVDETGILLPALEAASDEQLRFVALTEPVEVVREAVQAGAYDGYVVLPAGLLDGEGGVTYYTGEGGGLSARVRLEDVVERAVEQERLAAQDASPDVLEIVNASVPVRTVQLTETGEEVGSSELYAVVGFIMGFAIYIAVFIYGAQVMYGAMEEKNSRVVEVIVSSVKPYDLLMGKVLGIGAMGLLQMVIWSVLALAGLTFAGSIAAQFINPADLNLPADASQEAVLQAAEFNIPTFSPMIFVWFVLFFVGGYLLYASLFAAIGSAVEQQQDAQSLMAPVTMLIIIPILFITFLLESPNSPLSVVLSLIPFFSPILMVVRIAITDVPLWQSLLSYVLLLAAFVGAVWVSARIYRVGILMYGKKASFKDLFRWIRYA